MLLPPPKPENIELGLASKGRFVGDPTANSETEIPPGDTDTIDEGELWVLNQNRPNILFHTIL